MDSLVKKSVQIIVVACIGYVLQYLCHLYLANLMSPAEYGNFAVAVSMAFFLSMLVESGASKTFPKYVHYYQQRKELSLLSGFLRTYFIATLLLSILVIFVGSVLAYLDLSITSKGNPNETHPLILALWFVPFVAFSNLLTSLLKCIKLHVLFEAPRLAVFGLPILFVWILSLFGFKENDWYGVALFGVANLVVCAIYIYLAARHVPSAYIKTKPQYAWREWFGTAFPIMISHLFFVGIKQVDLYMVEAFEADEAGVGYFSVASQTAQGIILFYISLSLIYSPMISKAILQGNGHVKKILLKMAGIIGCVCLVFLLVLLFFGKWILGLFGEDYIQAYPTMLLLAAGASVNAITGGYITFLQYSAKQKLVLAVQLVVLLLAITLNALLIPQYGIIGAGFSSALCFTLMSVFLTVCALRLLSKD